MGFTKVLGAGISTTTNVRVGVITATKFVGDGSELNNLPSSGISEVVNDTTPQLGGNLDLNSSDVTGTGNINITGNYTGTGSVSDSMGPVRRLGTNTQSTSYTLVASDAGKAIIRTGGDITVPSSVFTAGDMVTIINDAATSASINQGSGLTMYTTSEAATGNRTLSQRGAATILFTSASVAYISGSGMSGV